MIIIKGINEAREVIRQARAGDKRIGLVPTMGALHAGHLSLVHAAARSCDFVVVTIFVNPTQFGPHEDFERYPRNQQADLTACVKAGAGMVFLPSTEAMYEPGAVTTVHVYGLAERLCGGSRPGHFDGVTTVVAKLFHILPADVAFFGEKDYQQLVVIRRMVQDLNMPIEIVGCPIVREPDGLAMSSRNVYLSADQRQRALALNQALTAAREHVVSGERSAGAILGRIRRRLEDAGISKIDYVEAVDLKDLTPVDRIDGPVRICLAVTLGSCRLIDNVGVAP